MSINDKVEKYTTPTEEEKKEARDAAIREATKEIPNWVKRAGKVIYPERFIEFGDFISSNIQSEYFTGGADIENLLSIMEALDNNVPED